MVVTPSGVERPAFVIHLPVGTSSITKVSVSVLTAIVPGCDGTLYVIGVGNYVILDLSALNTYI
jgi:hypothetical protein